ncbi:MAG: hypothetical protein AABY15_01175 [Nanoarchaeota archaeon]
MEIKLNGLEDIILILENDDFKKLTGRKSKDFSDDNIIKKFSIEAKIYFYLGNDIQDIFQKSEMEKINSEIGLSFPEEDDPTYYIDLLPNGIKRLEEEKRYICNYRGLKLEINLKCHG